MKYKKPLFSIVFFLLNATYTYAGTDPEMYWFKNETACDDVKITVRSFCAITEREHATIQHNSLCTEQELVLENGRGEKKVLDLLEHEPSDDDTHIATGLRCVSAGQKHYLLVSMNNGGNCDTCENDAVIGLDGRWKRYGARWFSIKKLEKNQIEKQQRAWFKQSPLFISNTTRD